MKKYALFFILVLAVVLRLYGINWDQGFHLHPDERQLIMVATSIHFWDQLNPNFFNYGSLPIYLLKGSAQLIDAVMKTSFATYDGLLYLGRLLSVLFDLGTLLVVYSIAKLLYKKIEVAVFSALLYALSFFIIQNTHFFVVDVFLTFFITATLYFLLYYTQKPHLKYVIGMASMFAAALATKVTSVIFLPIILLGIAAAPFFLAKKRKALNHTYEVGVNLILFGTVATLLYFLFMPYAFLDFLRFKSDTLAQTAMSKDAYVFPYTLQYVYTLPYWYFLKNIFFWGLGPAISILSLTGMGLEVAQLISYIRTKKYRRKFFVFVRDHFTQIAFVAFYSFFFIIIGHSAVKFMRYMLPMYPFFIILAGYGLYWFKLEIKLAAVVFMALVLVWTLAFVHIYTVPHTRITATKWILNNIPVGSSIAVEHWDDRLPLLESEKYSIQELTLYDLPDDQIKWEHINAVLNSSEYLIIASNRLYVPLQKLGDCKKYKVCYPETKSYYEKLFGNKLPFKEVAEFSDDPQLPLLPIRFSDQSADESFTVYDHPDIMIFKKGL